MLQDREQAQRVARLLDPLVRAVDGMVGEKVAMLVEVEYEGAPSTSSTAPCHLQAVRCAHHIAPGLRQGACQSAPCERL